MSTSAEVLVLRGGYRVEAEIVVRLLDLEFRGIQFAIQPDSSLRIGPGAVLTAQDRVWLAAHHEEVKSVIRYCNEIVELEREREAIVAPDHRPDERPGVVTRAMPA